MHCTQERLAKELAPYLKDIGGYAKATDKTLDLLFDEACQESLQMHCLDLADGYTRKKQYQQVILTQLPTRFKIKSFSSCPICSQL